MNRIKLKSLYTISAGLSTLSGLNMRCPYYCLPYHKPRFLPFREYQSKFVKTCFVSQINLLWSSFSEAPVTLLTRFFGYVNIHISHEAYEVELNYNTSKTWLNQTCRFCNYHVLWSMITAIKFGILASNLFHCRLLSLTQHLPVKYFNKITPFLHSWITP